MTTKYYVSYLRVSSEKQGRSGLGLEAQREAVTTFAASRRAVIIAEYIEVESGRKHDRPELAAAIAEAKRCGATLLIAKLDRLARSVATVSALMESGIDFLAADLPEANRFMIHIMSAVSEYEREQISARTKAALAAAKARGVKLGAFARVLKGRRIAEAEAHARSIEPIVSDILASGAMSVRAVAAALNARGIPARMGGPWWPSNAATMLTRLHLIESSPGRPVNS